MNPESIATRLLHEFKGECYLWGRGVLVGVGQLARSHGKRAIFIRDAFPGSDAITGEIRESLTKAGLSIEEEVAGAGANAPRQDLQRITEQLKAVDPDVIVSFGGGSTIDAAKAAEVLRTLGGEIDEYFGTGLVAKKLATTGRRLRPHVAIQSAASSGAHLTKYSNITDTARGQKKLIVDEAIVPAAPAFDFRVTDTAPKSLVMDGALDGISHALEVLFGAAGTESYQKIREVAQTGIGLLAENLPRAITDPGDKAARDALCLGTDLGAYCIMLGGTNGGHLTSFSLVDILSHGRACALMNPYYTVFFAPVIEEPLRMVGEIYKKAGMTGADLDRLHGRDLGVAVAEAMFTLARSIGFPTRLADVPSFTEGHITRALEAAKDPQLEMKLKNMPVPLTSAMIDQYMGPILEAAKTGMLQLIRNVR
jgi:alcohol dehydrogenase class IV